jgi:predicted O-methyltransferase YrrM
MNLGHLLQSVVEQVEGAGSDDVGHFGGRYEGGFQIQQRPVEFARLVCLLASYSPFASYLEIGTAAGGTTRFLTAWLRIDRTAVIDDGKHRKYPVWVSQNRKLVPNLAEYIGDSHSPGAHAFLRELRCSFDLVGIDGDHSYCGVRADWDVVEPFLAPRAIVWFHDVRACDGVARCWGELRRRHTVLLETDELGIGVLRRDETV